MFQKRIAVLLVAVLVALLLSSCNMNNNPPTNVKFLVQCSNNVVSISYTAGGMITPNYDSYIAGVLLQSSGGLLGLAGLDGMVPPPGMLPDGMDFPLMPAEPAGQSYTINIPITGPNDSFINDPWPDGTLFEIMISYDILGGGMDSGVLEYTNVPCTHGDSAQDAQSWTPKDGRINSDPGALGVIYPVSYGARGVGLHIYKVDPTISTGTLSLEVTPEMLAAVPALPSEYTIVARSADGYIELAKLPTGQYQVNIGPDAEGKIHVVVFNDISTGTPWQFFTANIYDQK